MYYEVNTVNIHLIQSIAIQEERTKKKRNKPKTNSKMIDLDPTLSIVTLNVDSLYTSIKRYM